LGKLIDGQLPFMRLGILHTINSNPKHNSSAQESA
jgi:hypothetical protein